MQFIVQVHSQTSQEYLPRTEIPKFKTSDLIVFLNLRQIVCDLFRYRLQDAENIVGDIAKAILQTDVISVAVGMLKNRKTQSRGAIYLSQLAARGLSTY